ncbi:CDKN2AIP N-terminal-like protein [Huso huso]|uniref:CDKN2AIP N-terminal-like protein n=2 Tax=Acipenseridae TaxID=7900 RepID=A0AAD8FZ66_ACIOX|nr:CDKN2AIP N-terminal-like protein [Acipenser ruthenus]XP_033908606.2 CDKN2AIP N-terminal-like protein [Acipenser ruthenus]KAK1159256.1 CDKN2AIP N-terminal-like protein [Acipenser oxyrinchus oxyrinchus]
MAGDDVEDFLKQNRDSADLVEKFQSISESEKQWKFRREFILRNLSEFQDTNIDHLLSLSMVWANHVFLGCRYSQDLMEKVKEMAEDIEVEDAPVFKTRDEIMKQRS